MTEVLEHLRSRNERLITIPRREPISEYCIGECSYNRSGVDCGTAAVSTLYEKLCCDEYDSQYQQTYELLYEQVCGLVESSTLSVGKDQIEKYIQNMYLSDVYDSDQTFHDHINGEYTAPINATLDDSEKRNLARLWLFYVAERGIEI
jgi:hypothetical protein